MFSLSHFSLSWKWCSIRLLMGHNFLFLSFPLSFLLACLLTLWPPVFLSLSGWKPWHTQRWLGSCTEHSVSVHWCQTPAEARGTQSYLRSPCLYQGRRGNAGEEHVEGCRDGRLVEAAGEFCVRRAGGHMVPSGCGGWNRKVAPQKRECPSTPELRNPHDAEKQDTLTIHLTSS